MLSERSWVKKGSIADGCATQIPLLMAYFLTFLIAPLLDLMSQRPLICMGRVFCKIKKLPREVRAREACRKYFSMVAAHFSPWPSRLYRNPRNLRNCALRRQEASAVWRAAFGDRRPLPHPTDISYPYDPEMVRIGAHVY